MSEVGLPATYSNICSSQRTSRSPVKSTAALPRVPRSLLLALSLVIGISACTSARSSTAIEEGPNQCVRRHSRPTPHTSADDLVAGLVDVGPFGPIQLGLDLTWTEDPYEDANWRFRLHSMRWVKALSQTYRATGDEKYLNAWRSYWLDWVEDNPVIEPASEIAWAHHPTGLRAKLLACALFDHPDEVWIQALLRTHGEMLKREDFYVNHGNHALNQAQGLLAAGCVLAEPDWIELGMARIDKLVPESITADGATNEGSISYAAYNFDRYSEALERIEACDQPIPPLLEARLPKLALFMAHSALPNGEMPLIGDANAKRYPAWFSPEVSYARSLGAEGVPPKAASRVYPIGGWAFGRTSWERSAMPDSVVYALRTGHASNIHSHDDLGHISIFGHGRRLLEDSGLFAYANRLNQYFYAAHAHNGVSVSPGFYQRDIGSQLAYTDSKPEYDLHVLDLTAWRRVSWVRRVLFSRDGGWFLIDDQIKSLRKPRTFTLNWHLAPGSNATLEGDTLRTRFQRGNAAITMLTQNHYLSTVTGRKSPMQGWVALKFGKMSPATVLEASTGFKTNSTRFVTLIMTARNSIAPIVRNLQINDDEIAATITVGERTDRVNWRGQRVDIACEQGCQG